jgi:hypothetical protein
MAMRSFSPAAKTVCFGQKTTRYSEVPMESLVRCMKLEKQAFHGYLYSRREKEVRRKEVRPG